MTSYDYDLVTIGGGSGGIATANRAAEHGAKVAVIEGSLLGGTCVNVGCVPKKISWYASQVADTLKKYAPHYGFDVTVPPLDYKRLKQNREAYIERARSSYTRTFRKNKVTVIEGYGFLVDDHTISINGQEITSEYIVLASGAKASIPDVAGKELLGDSDTFFAYDKLPKSVGIIGAGYIAVELADVLCALGTETHLYIRHEYPLRQFDEMIIETVYDNLLAQGVIVHQNVTLEKVNRDENQEKVAIFSDGTIGKHQDILVAIGRKANSKDLNLENVGVAIDKDGFILVDEFQTTAVKNIFAIGDVTGQKELTPVAIKAGRLLSERLFNHQENAKMDYNLIPTVIFANPAVGTVGLSEKEVRKLYNDDKIKVYTSTFRSMFTAVTSHPELIKMKLITVGEDERIVGLHAVGYGVDEMIQGYAVALKMGATKADFDATVAIHPTGSEEFVTMR